MNYTDSTDIVGREVYGTDGKKLGKVISMQGSDMLVEKGIFFPKDFYIPRSEIVRLDGDALILRGNSDLYLNGMDREGRWSGTSTDAASLNTSERRGDYGSIGNQELRVPVAEEELEARKVARQQGEVVIHKEVVTEQKQITVPVTREEVRVERTPISAPRAAAPGEATFKEETVRVPVTEEQVEVVKRPVVKEEVRVSKRPYTEEQRVAGSVRKEQVEVEGEDLTRRSTLDRDEDIHQAGPGRSDIDDDDTLV